MSVSGRHRKFRKREGGRDEERQRYYTEVLLALIEAELLDQSQGGSLREKPSVKTATGQSINQSRQKKKGGGHENTQHTTRCR